MTLTNDLSLFFFPARTLLLGPAKAKCNAVNVTFSRNRVGIVI